MGPKVGPINIGGDMAIRTNLLKVEGCRGLFIKNTVDANIKVFSEKTFSKFKNVTELHFTIRAKIHTKEYSLSLDPISTIGKKAKRIINEACEAREKKINEIKTGKFVTPTKMTVDQLWDEYSNHLIMTDKSKEKHVKNVTYLYNKHLKPKIGNINIKDVSTQMLQNIIHTMGNTPFRTDKDEKPVYYKPSSLDQIRKVFGPMFKYAAHYKRKYISSSPMNDVEIPQYDNAREFKVDKEKAEALYETLMTYPEIKFRGIFMFLLEGRRQGEVFGLTWDRVNLSTGKYYLPQEAHKGKKNLVFILPDHLIALLKQLPGEREGYVFKSDRASKANGGKPGGKINNIRKRWEGILKSLDIEGVTRHDIRHWIGNTLVNTNHSTATVARVLGHGDERTAKRYANTKEETARSAADDFHTILSSGGKK